MSCFDRIGLVALLGSAAVLAASTQVEATLIVADRARPKVLAGG